MKISTIFQMKNKKPTFRKLTIFLFWIVVWQLAALVIQNEILLSGPFTVLKELASDLQEIEFYRTVLMSLTRIMGGFLLGLAVGMLFGIAAFFKPFLEELFSPVISLLKSIPIASFVVLLLIWTGSRYLAVFIAFLVVFPNVYLHTMRGLKSTDKKLLEMAQVFRMGVGKKFFYLYFPAMLPFLISSIEISIGMSFKSGVAAEVIGTPDFSFGERLYMAKIHLNTAGVFAWTIVIILASYVMEKLVLWLVGRYKTVYPLRGSGVRAVRGVETRRAEKKQIANRPASQEKIQIRHLSKSYQGKEVLCDINLELERGKTYCLMAPSGGGKTTLFHILLGLVKADAGEIKEIDLSDTAAVFQEPRLLEEYSARDNAFLFGEFSKGRSLEETEYERLLPKESTGKAAKELSGGMQRRVAILRAMNKGASFIILDEPFSGLDEETKRITATYILEKKKNATLLVSTHNREDILLLKGEIIDGNESGFNRNHGGGA
ncbi:ATP-binding cassette domain-containing protein [Konateibacter massiliensis]|uniref:ATP-binding cassette domain-containing protein n=1 Tax=Konateibacter massiliensis TaxID=2002841 RepID=UPI000C146A7A|nr:ATP-binding cassette domain-containing protein [Konateibacter massiliensis]